MRVKILGLKPYFITLSIIMILEYGTRSVLAFSKQKYIVSAYFEPQIPIYTLVLLFFVPLFLICAGKIKVSLISIYVITVLIWCACLLFSKETRVYFSQFIGFPVAEDSFMDLRTIPSFIQCSNSTGCDPFGRVTGYGNGFKLLFPLQSWNLTLFVSLISALFIVYHFSKLTMHHKSLMILMAISPSWIFILERGNSTLIVMSLVVLVGGLSLKTELSKALSYLLLGAMKPFFFGALLGIKNFKTFMFSGFLSIFVYFASLNFDFNTIKESRIATIYYPSSQIGVDQLPAFIIQMITARINQEVQPWDGSSIFIVSQLLGLACLIITICLLVKCAPQLVRRTIRSANSLSDLSISCTGIYLVFYLSGSQVSYSAWISFPFLCFIATHVLTSRVKVSEIILLCYSAFATIGINNWFARSIGNQILAGFVLIAFYSIFKERLQKSNQ